MTLQERQDRIAELKAVAWRDRREANYAEVTSLEAPMKGTYGVDLIAKERAGIVIKDGDDILVWLDVCLSQSGAEEATGEIRKAWLIKLGAYCAAEIDRLTLEGVE